MIIALSAFIGLLVGSFLNVVAYRVPAGISIVRPPSACPSCQAPIQKRDNVPIVSWIVLRGRCRSCASPISIRYPVVEAAGGALFASTAVVVGSSWVLPAYLWFAALTLVLGVIDLDVRRIPNRVLYPGTVGAVLLLAAGAAIEGEGAGLVRGLLGGAGYFGGLLLIALVARGGFGMGDVKLGFVLGTFTAFRSWETLAVAVFGAFVLGGVVAVVLLAAGRARRRDLVPFGPALVAGSWIAIAVGDRIASWYLGG